MMDTVKYVGIVFLFVVGIIIVCVAAVIYVDSYVTHRELKKIRAEKHIKDETFKYWERESLISWDNTDSKKQKYRYTCPICVLTKDYPSRYCPDCGTRLKIK